MYPFLHRRFYRNPITTAAGFDPDVQAFIDFGVVTDPVIQSALDVLTIGMKDNGIWDKCKAIYPFVPGSYTATGRNTWSLNLKNIAEFSIGWSGGITFNGNGITGNGTDGYGDTDFNPFNELVLEDIHFSLYCRTNLSADQYDFGAGDADGRTWTNISYPGFNAIYDCNNSTDNSGRIFIANGGSQGNFILSRNNNNQMKLYKNSSILYTTTGANSGLFPNLNLYILNINLNGVPYVAGWSSKNFAFCTIGTKLNDAEAAIMDSLIAAFQTTLSRNV